MKKLVAGLLVLVLGLGAVGLADSNSQPSVSENQAYDSFSFKVFSYSVPSGWSSKEENTEEKKAERWHYSDVGNGLDGGYIYANEQQLNAVYTEDQLPQMWKDFITGMFGTDEVMQQTETITIGDAPGIKGYGSLALDSESFMFGYAAVLHEGILFALTYYRTDAEPAELMKEIDTLIQFVQISTPETTPEAELDYINIDAQYAEYARNPDVHKYELIEFTGEVIQVIEGEDESQYRIAIGAASDSVVYTTYIRTAGEARILKGDMVTVRGIFLGTVTYESTLGGQITVPSCTALTIVQYKPLAVSVTGTQDTESADEFPTIAYQYITSRKNHLFLAVTNGTGRNARVEIAVQYYDEDGRLVGVSNASRDAFESGCEILFVLSNDLPFATYEYTITAKDETYYVGVLSKLDVETTIVGNKAILAVTNTGNVAAKFAKYDVLYMNGDVVVDWDSGYITDSDSEIKPSKTQYKEETSSESFDSVNVFVYGYGNK